MMAGRQFARQINVAKRRLYDVKRRAGGMGKTLVAGVAGAVLLLGNLGKALQGNAARLRESAFNPKKTGEVITVKKSTVIALLVALATVAGVLGALYFYVLRREKELDEYEQLLFSEDFNDDADETDEAESASETAGDSDQ